MLQIDDFRPADQPLVRSLILAGLEEHWGALDPTRNCDLDDIGALHASGRTIVARRDGELLGTGTLRRIRGEAEIVRMSVRADMRGQGIGGALLDELVATAAVWGCARVVLETSASWTSTIRFYERNGFVITHCTGEGSAEDVWFERRLGPINRPAG